MNPTTLLLTCALMVQGQATFEKITVDPPRVLVAGPGSQFSLLVSGHTSDGGLLDMTREAKFRSLQPDRLRVDEGVIKGLRDGPGQVEVLAAGKTVVVDVEIQDSQKPRQYHFENDITPLLNRFSCNTSGCHGSSEGQNGFKLSVFGFDPAADYVALVKESRGRRIFAAAPEHSLFVAKAAGTIPHGGGIRIPPGTAEYDTLRNWIRAGMPVGAPDAPRVVSIRVEPSERTMPRLGQQQLRVIAKYSDGRQLDMTHHSRFQSNNDALASVNAFGLVSAGEVPGEAAIMASFMGEVAVFRALLPRPEKIDPYPQVVESNDLDRHVLSKLKKLNILPAELCDDAEYLRRVHLDIIGTLPTAEEARAFLTSKDPKKRKVLVDRLLDRPEYADYWALKWADLLRVDRQALGHKRAYAYFRWIRDSIAQDKPFDQFARELFTADGPLDQKGPANFFKVVTKPGEAASTLSQVFLGVRISCAECHHHPYDRWSQTDYYGMQSFFMPLGVRTSPRGDYVLASGSPQAKHPRTGQPVFAYALGSSMPEQDLAGDRRKVLADWLTQSDNPWFARNLANRMWAHFLGWGIVEPVDDVRATNPPSNAELLDALAKHLVDKNFGVKDLIRHIVASRTYQQATTPNATNAKDEQNYSRALFRRLDAEVLLDMVSQTTGIPEDFDGVPSGIRAIQLWDSKVSHYFLKVFGRPVRATACECERNHGPSVSQVLHLLNSPEIQAKLSHDGGAVARLTRAQADDRKLIEELYLTFLSRFPSDQERRSAEAYLKGSPSRQRGVEDLAWSLLNTVEFGFNH